MTLTAVPKFERFFREAADLDVDRNDLKRLSNFVLDKVYDLLIVGAAHAKANVRDVLEPWDLPITKGLQEGIHRFRQMDSELGLAPILEDLAARPQLDVTLSEETQQQLPSVAGGITVVLAGSFEILDPEVRNPSTRHWKRAFQLFNLVL